MFGLISNNRSIRRITTAFGSLFTNIALVRYNYTTNTEQERIIVPVQMGTKEKFIKVLEADPMADKSVQITLPIISYALMGMKYSSDRKQQTTLMNYTATNKSLTTQYAPVPYDLNFRVYIYVRNIEDGTQIIEQILPYFTPDYTLRLQLIPQMAIIKDIPIILNEVAYEIDSDGDHLGETRKVIWTLDFNVLGWIYGPVNTNASGIIREAIINIYDADSVYDKDIRLVIGKGFGQYLQGEIVYQGQTLETATASAVVDGWSSSSNRLIVSNATGMFTTNENIIGSQTNAAYNLLNYEIIPVSYETVTVTAESSNNTIGGFTLGMTPMGANTANIGENYIYDTTITTTY